MYRCNHMIDVYNSVAFDATVTLQLVIKPTCLHFCWLEIMQKLSVCNTVQRSVIGPVSLPITSSEYPNCIINQCDVTCYDNAGRQITETKLNIQTGLMIEKIYLSITIVITVWTLETVHETSNILSSNAPWRADILDNDCIQRRADSTWDALTYALTRYGWI
jgi:hypothetical protein